MNRANHHAPLLRTKYETDIGWWGSWINFFLFLKRNTIIHRKLFHLKVRENVYNKDIYKPDFLVVLAYFQERAPPYKFLRCCVPGNDVILLKLGNVHLKVYLAQNFCREYNVLALVLLVISYHVRELVFLLEENAFYLQKKQCLVTPRELTWCTLYRV